MKTVKNARPKTRRMGKKEMKKTKGGAQVIAIGIAQGGGT